MARILIVEDKDSLRAMLEEMLRAEGLQVVGRRPTAPRPSSGCAGESASTSS